MGGVVENRFFEHPILNSPYESPRRHWELDKSGQPTQEIIESRRRADFITPIPKPKKRRSEAKQGELTFRDQAGVSTKSQQYEITSNINQVRSFVDAWRMRPASSWGVTPETARLLQHWRYHQFASVRPFFCQVEAAETAIWLTEVAPHDANAKALLAYLAQANHQANQNLNRLALKLATGAGKTTVMAMLIAWQTVNAVRRPNSKQYTRGFLIVAPGITIRDRLRVLQPNDPDSYYSRRELVPPEMLDDIKRAKIVITNYHSFMPRERMEVSKGTRGLLKGRTGEDIETKETEGQIIQRVMPDLMGMKNIMVLNDEAHHCYCQKADEEDDEELKGEQREEAEERSKAARVWFAGLQLVNSKLGINRVIDLSATPFFLQGSGYEEGALFPWTMSDFSLMDAIECGIVKLPRVPVAENISSTDMPMYRELWLHIAKDLPRARRSAEQAFDPLKLPAKLVTALESLYGHYEKTFRLWQKSKTRVPPCFIIVCQNTAISKLVYEYVSGFIRTHSDGTTALQNGNLPLFRNFDESTGRPLARPNTLLIDSAQLESGEAFDKDFHEMAADEIERFRREKVERSGDARAAEEITEQELLREVMNTVGKDGQLGAQIRCVVSVSMLTEGWDANNVTHILGIRAFGTQLLCEQVVGRALRRQSYELNSNGLFDTEYADIFGVPFDFTAKPVVAPHKPPVESVQVRAMRPERDHLEIRFPRVQGYRIELPEERLTAHFTDESKLVLTPEMVGPTVTLNHGIIGASADMTVKHLENTRKSELLFHLTRHLIYAHWREPGEDPPINLFGQLKTIAEQWLDSCLECKGGTYPAQLRHYELAALACNKITAGITRAFADRRPIHAMLDPYRPVGTTAEVRFGTSRTERWDTSGPPPKCHLNWIVYDKGWEAEFCRVAEAHPRVKAYVKNLGLGFSVPYLMGSEMHAYLPDFIVLVDDGEPDPLHMVVEIKGFRGEDAKEKKATMESYWIPGVNNLKEYGRWAFLELTDMHTIQSEFARAIEERMTTVGVS